MLEDTSRKGYAARGASIGCLAALSFWFVPVPVAAFVWLFGLRGPFVDYMLLAIPGFLALPLVGAVIGLLVRRGKDTDPSGNPRVGEEANQG